MYMDTMIANLTEKLTMEEKLNVVADELAGQYQDKLGAFRHITHMYPSSPAVLEIIYLTITFNIRHHLIKASIESQYIRYLQETYN